MLTGVLNHCKAAEPLPSQVVTERATFTAVALPVQEVMTRNGVFATQRTPPLLSAPSGLIASSSPFRLPVRSINFGIGYLLIAEYIVSLLRVFHLSIQFANAGRGRRAAAPTSSSWVL